MPAELTEVHKQRIRLAVRARQDGSIVKFRIDEDKVVWYRANRTGIDHVICRGYGQMPPLLEAIQAEYYTQCAQVENQ